MRILSINIWDIPIFSKDRHLRLQRLTDFLKKDKPEIVCIQESWDIKTRKKILSACSFYNCPAICAKSSVLPNLSGGLITLVDKNIKIESAQFLKFKHQGISLEDSMIKKGFLVVKIIYRGKALTIVNTHLHRALVGLDEDRVRQKQFQEIEAYGAKLQKPILLAGDFQDITNLYSTIINHGYKDLIANPAPTVDSQNPYTLAMLNRFLSKQIHLEARVGVRQDLIFSKNDKSCPVIPMESRNVFNTKNTLVSDHYGVLLDFKLG